MNARRTKDVDLHIAYLEIWRIAIVALAALPFSLTHAHPNRLALRVSSG